jgi:hypothetical protein
MIIAPIEIPKSEIIQAVLPISSAIKGKGYGSSLAFPINNKLHLITAAHVLEGLPHGVISNISLFKDNKWIKIEAMPYFYNERPYNRGDIDLVLIKTSNQYDDHNNITLNNGGMIYGQDAYFLGYPYFDHLGYKAETYNNGFPMPFIKKVLISNFSDPQRIYLDGHNNPGFSGGPVVFWDYNAKKHKICGFISGYIPQQGKIFEKQEKNAIEILKQFHHENSGLAFAYSSKLINEIIDKSTY